MIFNFMRIIQRTRGKKGGRNKGEDSSGEGSREATRLRGGTPRGRTGEEGARGGKWLGIKAI